MEIWDRIDKGGFVRDHEIKLRRKDGIAIDCLFSGTARRTDARGIVGYQGIIRDITERKMLEAQLQQAQKIEAIGTLAGGIAHDFNNIIGIIIINAELAMDDVPEGNPAHVNLSEIYKACVRARDLVRQILAFSRQTRKELRPIGIDSIIKESIKLLRSTIPTTIEIRYDISSGPDTVNADPTQINQVLLNLCANAAHAMRKKGGILEIRVENVEVNDDPMPQYHDLAPGKYIQLTVSDTGHGIKPEVKAQIFEPYFTTKAVGEGSGMGLSVVHGIVKSHCGAVSVDSEPDKGAAFHVLLPLFDGDIGEECGTTEDIPRGNERILFVDDEVAAVDITRRMLERLGYHVEAESSSVEALETFRGKPDAFDLVITDMTMPFMTGVDLFKEIMKIRHDIPVIICTGYNEMINEDIAKELGITLVMKPLINREIAGKIRSVLEKK